MRIVPALDVMGGRAVRGRGGRREEYRSEPSVLASGDDPAEQAAALCRSVSGAAVYVADLDAIMGLAPPNAALPATLRAKGLQVWLDAGVREAEDISSVRAAGASRVVVGTETWRGAAREEFAGDVLLSLDMNEGKLRAPPGAWPADDPETVAEIAVRQGVRAMLLLDVADVGGHAGPRTLPLLGRLKKRFPQVEWLVGGGVRELDDLRRCRAAGAAGAVVASALHEGRIAAADLAELRAEASPAFPGRTR